MNKLNEWNHIFKLDPNKPISDGDLRALCYSGTDAFIIGGTDGVTFENVTDLLDRLEVYDLPCLLEVSDIEAIAPGFDGYLIPIVLNSQEKHWMFDVQHQAIKEYGDIIDWNHMMAEGYCVLNPEAKVFQHTNCYMPDAEDIVAFARMSEHMLKLPIFYIEYSGTYGDPDLVRRAAKECTDTTVVYGGGITTRKQAAEMSAFADVIIVGDIIYENIEAALQTVIAEK